MNLNDFYKECAVLRVKNGHPVPLTGIDVSGNIDDVLSRVKITQTYENREEKNIEAVYSFPLPSDAVLLDFTVTIDGRVRHGTVMKKSQARARYEEAVEQGDSAAMLEDNGEGLYSMSVGNLLAGQKIEISFSYSLFNIWNGKLLRFYLPTVIAPKFGDPSKAGIDDYLAPVTSVSASNALKCVITVSGNLVRHAISSPTHKMERTEKDGKVSLAVNTLADSDFILEIRSENEPVPYACIGRDGDKYVAAVAMTPDFGSEMKDMERDIDIIIDCSGSMSGQSIIQARSALKQILSHLTAKDSFNIIRFGSTVQPLFNGHSLYTSESFARAQELVNALDANLGGTNLEDALDAAYKTHVSGRIHDIMLITDGEVYENELFYQNAVKSECRIFTVGVGNAVSEGLLKRLARETNGKAEFVTPNEDMAERIFRHFQRMSMPSSNASVTWPEQPEWVWPVLNPKLFHGDTSVFFAGFARKPSGTVTLTSVSDAGTTSWNCELPDNADEKECSDLARMAVRIKISGRKDNEAADLAVKYSLVSPLTNYLLVEVNENKDNIELPEMRTVPQMAPRGMMGAAAMCCASAQAMSSAPSGMMMGMTGGIMAFASRMMGMKMASKASASCDSSAEAAKTADNSVAKTVPASDGTWAGFSRVLASLDLSQVRWLFGERSIDALKKYGLTDAQAAIMNAIAATGMAERTVFEIFLEKLRSGNEAVFASAVITQYIKRSYDRISSQDKTLSPEVENLFKSLMAAG